jgi:hypothetical protein
MIRRQYVTELPVPTTGHIWSLLETLLSLIWMWICNKLIIYVLFWFTLCYLIVEGYICNWLIYNHFEQLDPMADVIRLRITGLVQYNNQRDQRGVAPADCWNRGEWGLKVGIPWLVRWVRRAGTRDFFLPWLLWSAQYKIVFYSPYTISIYVSPSPSNLGRQSCRATCH